MALYDLVRLRNSLTAAVNADRAVNELQDLCQRLRNVKIELPDTPPEHVAYIDSLVQTYEQLIAKTQQPVDEFELQLQTINDQITELSHRLFANNYDLEEHYGNVDHVRANRHIYVDSEVQQIVQQRIFVYTNWRYPALEIGCRDGEWTQYLVAADPLYIMDRLPEFLNITNDRFAPEYQRRLRKYPLIDHNLSALPQNQIGFAFSWGYFNFISVDTMHQVLKQMRNVLRPGGVFMFSYNDGDTAAGAGMAENFAQSYMPKSLLVPLCLSLGFEIVNESTYGTNISWIEIQRPGKLHTVKAHQVFGQIHNRPGME